MDDTSTRSCGWRSGTVTAALLTGLAFFVAACGGPDGGSPAGTGQSDVAIDDSTGENGGSTDGGTTNGGADGGGLGWPPLPEGPDIPEQDEIDIYPVLAAADAPRCADLFTEGVAVQFGNRTAEARFAASPPGNFGTGSRTYHLYRAAAYLCANDGANAQSAFADALSEPPWSEPLDEVEANLQLVVCRVWDAVTALLDPGAGPCTLTVSSPEDPSGDTDADGDGTDDTETDDTGTAGAEDGGDDQSDAGGTDEDGAVSLRRPDALAAAPR